MERKRALVLGASQGIGSCVAQNLAENGTRVTLFSRSEDKLKSLSENLTGDGHWSKW